MTEVYFLLRNNEQSGPYSLDDLAALQLTEKDLVRQADKQTGWFHPYELGLPYMLSWHVQKQNGNGISKPSPKPVMQTSTPVISTLPPEPDVDPVDQTIEELSKKITAIRNNLKMVEEQIHAEAEEQAKAPVSVKLKEKKVKQKKEKQFSFTWILFILILAAVSVLAWMLYMQFFEANTSAARNNKTGDELAVGSFAFEYPQQNLFFNDPAPAEAFPSSAAYDSSAIAAAHSLVAKPKAPQRRRSAPRRVTKGPVAAVATQVKDSGFRPENLTDERRVALSFVMAEEERKTLLQKIAALFKKKEEPVNTNQNPVTEETVYDKFKIGIHTTNYPWLKGVQGLTLTLQNKSSQTIRYATVNVVYYTTENAVIERSVIHFKNVLPGKTQAVAAPDHQWAHHAGYEIVSAAVVKP